jgi:hypothetical protein
LFADEVGVAFLDFEVVGGEGFPGGGLFVSDGKHNRRLAGREAEHVPQREVLGMDERVRLQREEGVSGGGDECLLTPPGVL